MLHIPKRIVRVVLRLALLATIIGAGVFLVLQSFPQLRDKPAFVLSDAYGKMKEQMESGLQVVKGYAGSSQSPAEDSATDYSPLTWTQIQSRLTFTKKSDQTRKQIIDGNYKRFVSLLSTHISEPKVDGLVRQPENADTYQRANATLMILARNRDLGSVTSTIRQIERHFNNKFHYPYVLLNDGDFSERFKDHVRKAVSGEAYFEKVAPEDWEQPEWVDVKKQNEDMKQLASENVAYARKLSYHNMCRYYSRGFYNHPRMRQFKYCWRFEPATSYFCDIDYDVFKFMEDNDKTYGFTISLYDIHQSVRTLWPHTLEFVQQHPDYVNPNGAFSWLVEDLQNPEKTKVANGYSTCHFWSNFEIADMDFFRGKAYSEWVEHLDSTGGFYYERWGDAPVHSVGLSLFEDKSKIHWFRDIGYKHDPYTNCPNSDKCSKCVAGKFTYDSLRSENCLTNWWDFEMDDDAKSMY